ncbi:MAG TPA: dihydrodipicolinate synthase family protein [Bryobacteraceae bacterium]|jgi:dihydrodipicolinate synthase/N-acetylneuraminate lyase|nr:dihydrodipicolinate synthase family protein [Bryobacteraceae bacterium]
MARPARQIELRGVFASAITPRHKNSQESDFSAALDLLDFLAAGGVQGICLLGATGEFLDYSFMDRQRLVYLGVKRSRVPIIAGVSHSTLAGSIELADEAISSGADALILMPPWFYPYSQCEIEQFYREFARETSDAVPILLHNLPQCTSQIEIETVRRLIDTGRFAGIKDSSGAWDYFSQLLALKRERPFSLFGGADGLAAQALAEGADGIISASACAVPELLVALARSGSAEHEGARLREFVERVNRFPFPVAIKRAVELRGQKAGPPLVPLSPENQRALEEFSSWFKEWIRRA